MLLSMHKKCNVVMAEQEEIKIKNYYLSINK